MRSSGSIAANPAVLSDERRTRVAAYADHVNVGHFARSGSRTCRAHFQRWVSQRIPREDIGRERPRGRLVPRERAWPAGWHGRPLLGGCSRTGGLARRVDAKRPEVLNLAPLARSIKLRRTPFNVSQLSSIKTGARTSTSASTSERFGSQGTWRTSPLDKRATRGDRSGPARCRHADRTRRGSPGDRGGPTCCGSRAPTLTSPADRLRVTRDSSFAAKATCRAQAMAVVDPRFAARSSSSRAIAKPPLRSDLGRARTPITTQPRQSSTVPTARKKPAKCKADMRSARSSPGVTRGGSRSGGTGRPWPSRTIEFLVKSLARWSKSSSSSRWSFASMMLVSTVAAHSKMWSLMQMRALVPIEYPDHQPIPYAVSSRSSKMGDDPRSAQGRRRRRADLRSDRRGAERR